MRRLIVAVRFLTRLPTPRMTVREGDFAGSMRWFPAVGSIIGILVTGGAWAGARIDPWTGALVGLSLWVAVTGALHLDGLGDVADACGAAHKDRQRILAVLADPHLGSFGATTIAVQLIAKLVLLHALIADGGFVAIALVPGAARIGPLVWSRWLPDLHHGLASRFRGAVRPSDLMVWAIALLAAARLSPALLIVPLLVLGWGWWIRARLGGISGDGHGAGIEVTESLSLLAAAMLDGLT